MKIPLALGVEMNLLKPEALGNVNPFIIKCLLYVSNSLSIGSKRILMTIIFLTSRCHLILYHYSTNMKTPNAFNLM